MNGYGAFPGDGSDNRGGGVHPGGRGDGVLSGSDLRRRPFPPPEYGLAFGGNREGSAFDDHRGHGAGGGGDDRGGNFDHRSRLGYPPHHENDHDEDNRGPTRFGGVYEDGFGGGSTRNRLPQPQPSYDARTFGGASMMMQERTARQQGGNGSDSGLYGNGGAGGDGRGEPVSFGCDNFQDPLDKDRPPPQHPHDDGGGATKPGVRFCSSHDAVSAKIAASDGKGGVPAAHHPQIEIAPGIMARLRGAKETWECVENDFYLPVTCFCCSTDLLCIMDANYVLCPTCKVVSPMEGCAEGGGLDGGVGLGFTFDDLQQWQHEILLRRSRR